MIDLFLAAAGLVLFAAGIVWFELRAARADRRSPKKGARR